MSLKYFAIVYALGILIFVVELIRREKMTFKYALTWLAICLTAIPFAVSDRVLYGVTYFAGFSLPSNFIFFLFLIFGVFLCLLLTLYANEQNKRSEILGQSIAILESRLRQLEDEVREKLKK